MKIRISFLVIVLSAFIVGCTEDFEEINTDPNAVGITEPGFFFNPILQNPLRNYQRNINLYPDLYSQYWSNSNSGFESSRYEYVDPWIGNKWSEFYAETLAEANTLSGWYAENPIYTNSLAQLEIWMCAEWARMAQNYGDIPYFGAGKGVSVPHNSEKEIYYDLFERLKNAVDIIDPDDTSQYAYSESEDLLFRGDLEKWKRFGNSIRLRLAMRLSNIEPAKAQMEAMAAINDGVMINNDDGANIPISVNGSSDYLHILALNFNEIRISKTFTDLMYNQSSDEDPRARRWLTYTPGSPLEGGNFEGLINGFDIVPDNANDFATMNTEGGYPGFVGGGEVQLSMPIMFYSEVLFLQAEAALRGWVPGDANALYLEGIKASMDFVGVDAADATTYMNAIPQLSGSNEAQLKQLITQKYIANFPNGVEAWADFRRTDYPDISLPIDGVSGNSSVAPDTWVKRIRYPNNAHEQGSEFLPASRNTIPADRMDIRLWWDTADTKTKSGGLMNSNF